MSKSRRKSISTAVGALTGAILGGIIEGLNLAVFLADRHRAGADPFEGGDLDHLALKAIVTVSAGIIGAVIGRVLAAPRVRERRAHHARLGLWRL